MKSLSKRVGVVDLSICFSIFPDNKRSPDSGNFQIQVQVFQNESDITGSKDYITLWDRVLTSLSGPLSVGHPYKIKNHWWNAESPVHKKYKHTPVFKKWLDHNGEIRPHHWVNMCLLMDSVQNMYTLFINGEHLCTEELRFSPSSNNQWPKMEMTHLIFGAKFTSSNHVPIGKFTALNIYSRILSTTEATEISSE